MSTRKVKDAKDLSTNELIYFKGHAQATYMSDGRTVEEAITSSTGGSGGTIDTSNFVTKAILDGVTYTPSNGTLNFGYVNKSVNESANSYINLRPNVYNRNTNTSLSSFSFSLGGVSNANIINEYFIEFTTSSSGTTVSLPTGIKWANGEAPTFEAGCTYQVSIVNNLGTWVKFK